MAAQAAVDAPMTMPVDNVIAGFAPVVDGVTLLRDAYSGAAPEISAGIPMMIGTCRWEQAAMYRTDPAVMGRKLTLLDAEERLRPALGSDTGRIVAGVRSRLPRADPLELFLLIDTERSYSAAFHKDGGAARSPRQGADLHVPFELGIRRRQMANY